MLADLPSRIRTKRLLLRRAVPADLQAMHAVLSDPVATRFWSTPPHKALAQTESWLRGMIDVGHDDFVIESNGLVIGKAGFYQDPEIGFIFLTAATGRGFGREAVYAVAERALFQRGLTSIEADVDPRNSRSLSLLSAIGFVECGRKAGTWKVGDQICDSVYLRATRDSLRADPGPRSTD